MVFEPTYYTATPLYYYCHDYASMGGAMQTDIAAKNLNGSAAAYTLDVYPAQVRIPYAL